MKRVLFLLLLVGCVRDPYAPEPNYIRDDLYCWHLGQDNVWHVQGFSRQCPENARKDDVHVLYPDR